MPRNPYSGPRPMGPNRPAPNGRPSSVQRSFASQLKEHEALFNTYEHLNGLPRGDDALKLLRKVASIVKPIMRKHGWHVQTLAEFLPAQENLLGLNINAGHKICVRLRYHRNHDLFLPLEELVDTMLHELSHNVWGEHDSNFHKLWDDLRDEHETLARKGYTGEGFVSEGKRLGGHGSRPPPPDEMRRLARASAEKRKLQGTLSRGSGQKLGGTPLHLYGADVRNIIADQITRRNTINRGCASGSKDAGKLSDQSSSNTFKTKADEDDANNRAIAQALYELMEQEEEQKLNGTWKDTSTHGGLAWDAKTGLYDAKSEPSALKGPSHPPTEEEQLEWALQESTRSTPASGRPTSQSRSSQPSATPPIPYHAKPPPSNPIFPSTHDRASPVAPNHPTREQRPDAAPLIDLTDTWDPTAPPRDDSNVEQWACEVCTCLNPLRYLACEACGVERTPPSMAQKARSSQPAPTRKTKTMKPEPRRLLSSERGGSTASSTATKPSRESLGWNCIECGAFMEHKWWTCSACGKMKEAS